MIWSIRTYFRLFYNNLSIFFSNSTYDVKNKKLDFEPHIPEFLKPDGEFMVIYPGQLMIRRNDFKLHIEQTRRTVKYQNYSAKSDIFLLSSENTHRY